MRLQLVLKCDDLTTGIREFFRLYDWDPGILEFYLTFLFPGPEGVPGIPLASSKGEVALECPHILDALAAVSVTVLPVRQPLT